MREMEKNAVEEKTEPIRFQIILGEDVEKALQRYIGDNFPHGTRVYTALIRKAVAEFLKKEGYLE